MLSPSKSRTLIDHEEIRRWAEERGAKPAARGSRVRENSGVIDLEVPGEDGGASLQEIEWSRWFNTFEKNRLALVVQDETAEGGKGTFNKLVVRESIEAYIEETSENRKDRASSGRKAA